MSAPAAGPHRRGAAVAATVLDATLALLAERGYAFSVDEVAARAGVHKTTVYRRWETRPALVAAALRRLAEREVVAPETGDPLADLEELALSVARALRHPAGGNALRAALSAAGEDPEFRDAAAALLASRYALATRLVEQAQAAGAVRPEVDPVLLWQAVVNPLHLNTATGGPVDEATARALVELVLTGARTAG